MKKPGTDFRKKIWHPSKLISQFHFFFLQTFWISFVHQLGSFHLQTALWSEHFDESTLFLQEEDKASRERLLRPRAHRALWIQADRLCGRARGLPVLSPICSLLQMFLSCPHVLCLPEGWLPLQPLSIRHSEWQLWTEHKYLSRDFYPGANQQMQPQGCRSPAPAEFGAQERCMEWA